MPQSRQSEFKLRFRIVLGVLVVFSIYLTGFLNCLIYTKYAISFWNITKAFFTCSTTLVIFPITLFICLGVAALIAHKTWDDARYDDKFGRNFRHSREADPYGDAHALEPHEYKEIAQVRTLSRCKGPVLGQLTTEGGECIDFTDYSGRYYNKNIIAIALPGGGKSFSFVQPMVYQAVKARHSIVVTDSKGALYEDISEYLRDQGYVVRKLDLTNLRKSDGWDCMKILKGEDQGTYTQIFANTIISNISNENNIYSSGGNSLLNALLLRVLLGHDYAPEQKNIRSVYELLQNPAGYDFLEQKFDKNLLQDDELPCLGPYLAYKQASGNLAANIATHLANGLQLFQNQLVCEILSRDDMDMTLPGRVPCAYFCQFPDNHDTYRFLISLFFSMFFLTLMEYADHHTEKRRLDIPVDFIMDEFFSIGIIPEWAAKMSTIRSRGITATMILQDIAQLQTRYLDSWKTIINDTATMVTLGINDSVETAPFLSKRIGVTTIEVKSTQETDFAGDTRAELFHRKNTGAGKRDLLTPDEIMKLGKDECLILFAGKNVIKANKTPHTMWPDADYLTPIRPDKNVPGTDMPAMIDFKDHAAKDELVRCETAYRRQFWAADEKCPIGQDGINDEDKTRPAIPETMAITDWCGAHTMHPDLKIKDLSDAMYTEEPISPVTVALGIVKYDITALIRWAKKKINHEEDDDESVKQSDVPDDYISHYKLAPKGSFREFCKTYLEESKNRSEDSAWDEEDDIGFVPAPEAVPKPEAVSVHVDDKKPAQKDPGVPDGKNAAKGAADAKAQNEKKDPAPAATTESEKKPSANPPKKQTKSNVPKIMIDTPSVVMTNFAAPPSKNKGDK